MELRFEAEVRTSAAKVFEFHQRPSNLALLMEGWQGLHLLHHNDRVQSGSQLWIEQTVAGWIPIVMGFEHVESAPPHRFNERLIHGPFSRFDHTHEFEPTEGGCIIRDLLVVSLPWYFGGDTAIKILVAPALRRAFALRRRTLGRLFTIAE